MQNKRLTDSAWHQHVSNITIALPECVTPDSSSPNPLYTSGDVAVIHPHNADSSVDRMLKILLELPYECSTVKNEPTKGIE
jgi:hypothetical protein